MSTGLVDIYEVKRSQRHLLAAIENSRLVSPIFMLNMILHQKILNLYKQIMPKNNKTVNKIADKFADKINEQLVIVK